MKQLSDQLLIEVYETAVQLKLDKEFIDIVKREMADRDLIVKPGKYN